MERTALSKEETEVWRGRKEGTSLTVETGQPLPLYSNVCKPANAGCRAAFLFLFVKTTIIQLRLDIHRPNADGR